jgi:hypothetical protein
VGCGEARSSPRPRQTLVEIDDGVGDRLELRVACAGDERVDGSAAGCGVGSGQDVNQKIAFAVAGWWAEGERARSIKCGSERARWPFRMIFFFVT